MLPALLQGGAVLYVARECTDTRIRRQLIQGIMMNQLHDASMTQFAP